jgi:hypothetical protein
MSDQSAQRHYSRIPWDSEAILHFSDGVWRGKVRDISLNGMLVEVPPGTAPSGYCWVTIPLGAASEPAIEAEAWVARVLAQGVALRFETMDLDSATHLRTLLTQNSPDPEAMEREVQHLRLWSARGGN